MLAIDMLTGEVEKLDNSLYLENSELPGRFRWLHEVSGEELVPILPQTLYRILEAIRDD